MCGQKVDVRIIFLLPFATLAQQPVKVPLANALEQVARVDPMIVYSQLSAEFQNVMKVTARTVPKTFAEMELGQNEGPFVDLRMAATQSFQPMGLARRLNDMYEARYQAAMVQGMVVKRDLNRMVRQLYNQFSAGETLLQQLSELDSVFSSSIKLSERRAAAGETDRMEKLNLELLAAQVVQFKMETETQQETLRKRLAILLKSEQRVEPVNYWYSNIYSPLIGDTDVLARHPVVQWRLQEQKAAQMNTLAEKAMNNVEWVVGFNSISVTGWQTSKDGLTDSYYDIGDRFFSGTVGVHIPIFNRGRRARVEAAGLQERMAGTMVDSELRQLRVAYGQTLAEWQGLQEQIKYMERETLPRVDMVLETTKRRLAAGSINILEWNVAIKQVIQARFDHIELRRRVEDKIIDLQYFNEQ